jgi:hypothetical protein
MGRGKPASAGLASHSKTRHSLQWIGRAATPFYETEPAMSGASAASVLFAAAFDLQSFCRERGWRFCFIGGIAVERWAVPRFTEDADMTLLTNFIHDEECISMLLGRFAARNRDPAEFAVRARVLLLRHENGVELDVALGALDFEARTIERGSWWKARPCCELFTCSAEDLIVHKAFASRDRDWADVQSIVAVQRARLDVDQIRAELAPLAALKEDESILPRLDRLLREQGLDGAAL